MKTLKRAALAAAVSLLVANTAMAAGSVLIVGADYDPPQAELMATGLFSQVDVYNSTTGTPTLAQLQGYSAVLEYTNYIPANGTALGDVLKSYVDAGGGLVLDTYSFSSPWSVGGGIMGAGYSPLVGTGVNADVSGRLVATQSDAIYAGVDLNALVYFHNGNFAQPGLDAGATLLATDGNGVNMIARNASGRIIANNLFPGEGLGNDANFYQLTANELVSVSSVPEPASAGLMLGGLGFVGVFARRRQRKAA